MAVASHNTAMASHTTTTASHGTASASHSMATGTEVGDGNEVDKADYCQKVISFYMAVHMHYSVIHWHDHCLYTWLIN